MTAGSVRDNPRRSVRLDFVFGSFWYVVGDVDVAFSLFRSSSRCCGQATADSAHSFWLQPPKRLRPQSFTIIGRLSNPKFTNSAGQRRQTHPWLQAGKEDVHIL